ncbi:carboxymuconolactone decarboxylase family protein [Sphingomonas sp.]|uniref:carboxymuconolactone decarboxylase family protein n=1 Tax=Sphingomonas sp. TaxID=28214 RepID=UPI001B0BA583|nr:carboxymuconolactone decarboxylase family protein [Sphingomonas sp.]MBO9711760.1 carboxymuconolactone decarboxylase family protein [Sphingomonas sp.]
MPPIPYKDDYAEDALDVVAALRERRGGRLLNLDRMLLHSPRIAAGWSALMAPVRASPHVSPRHRELAICAVAKLNGADYEFRHHTGPWLRDGGTQEQLDALDDVEAAARNEALFDEAERTVLAFTLESTRDVRVSPATVAAMQAHFPDPAAYFELMMVVASYNMVSRVLVGLGIEFETPVAA